MLLLPESDYFHVGGGIILTSGLLFGSELS